MAAPTITRPAARIAHAAPPPAEPSRWRSLLLTAVVAGVPAVAMAVVAAIGSGGRALWQNEYVAWYAARLSAGDLWRLVNHLDMDKVTYFAGLHLWINLAGDSPAAMRAPSVAAMAVAAAATALVGRRLFGTLAGLLAGLLMAGLPALSRYGAEISSYALVLAAVAVSTVLLLRAFDNPSTARWVAYGASITCIGYLHFVALLILIPQALLYHRAVKADPDADAPDWPVAAYLALFPIAPLIWVSHGQSGAISWIRMRPGDVMAYPTHLFLSASVAGVVCFTALAGGVLLFVRRVHRWKVAFLVLWAVLPPVLGALTFRWFHLFLPRYYLYTLPALALLFAAVATSLLRKVRAHRIVVAGVATVLVAFVVAVGYPGQQQVRRSPTDGGPDLRTAVAAIAAQHQPGDGIAYAGDDTRLYARQAVAYELRGKPRPRDVFAQVTSVERGAYGAIECAKPVECLGATTRIWLLSTAPAAKDPTTQMSNLAIAELLRKQFTAGPAQRFQRTRVVLLIKKPPAPPPVAVAKLVPAKPVPAKPVPAKPAPTPTRAAKTPPPRR